MSSSRVEIDLRALDHNLKVLRSVVTHSPAADAPEAPARAPVSICAVLKQDAYGMGAVRIAKRLLTANTGGAGGGGPVEMLAVYALEEVRELTEANVNPPILVLKPISDLDRTDPTYRVAAAGRLHLSLHDLDQLTHLERLVTRLGFSIPVHVYVDTGMGRGGALPEEATQIIRRIAASPGGGAAGASGARIRLAGVMTHFASPCTDPAFTREQARTFREWAAAVRPMLPNQGAGLALHAANTCGTLRSEKYHGTMVRVGQSLFGYGPEGVPDADSLGFAEAARSLQPAVRWASSIVHIKEIPAGFPVGYGSTWHAPNRRGGRPTRIALVPVGYADGYSRSLSNLGQVGLSGRRWDPKGQGPQNPGGHEPACAPAAIAPVVGRVSMDQITLDVTDIPPQLAYVGAEVELAGMDRAAANYLPTVAQAAGSIAHEFLCRIGPRVERVYKHATLAAPVPARAPAAAAPLGRAHGHGGLGGAAAVA